MAETIEITVGNWHAGLHDDMTEQVGEQYAEYLRQNTETAIHEFLQQLERQQEAAMQQTGGATTVDDIDGDAVEEIELDD